jgi:D-alanine-D-alanine ligase
MLPIDREFMRPTRVLILYNKPTLPAQHPDAESEHEIVHTVEAVAQELGDAGFEVMRLGATNDLGELIDQLRRLAPDVTFNLFEGFPDDTASEGTVAGILEWLGIPFTGCPSLAIHLARGKHLAKQLFRGAGLSTPEFMVIDRLPVGECSLEWPVIVKPCLQDASVGLDQGSVVTDTWHLEERVAHLLRSYGPPVLIEQFIRGREFNASLIEAPELRVLPLSEIVFEDSDPAFWPIVTYEGKWKPGSRDFDATPPRFASAITPDLAQRLETAARQVFRLLGCRDYARVDIRVSDAGQPFLLEVNPNPDYSPVAGLAGALTTAGLGHAQFTVDLVRAALARGGRASQVPACQPLTPKEEGRLT